MKHLCVDDKPLCGTTKKVALVPLTSLPQYKTQHPKIVCGRCHEIGAQLLRTALSVLVRWGNKVQ